MENLLQNPSFDGGWTSPPGDSNQIPNFWAFWYASPDLPNPYDPAEHSKWIKPELVHRNRGQLPPYEWPLFFWDDGEWTLKLFKDSGSIWTRLTQSVELEPGRYRLTINFYSDTYIWDGEQKVEPPDPNTGLVRLICEDTEEWRTMKPFIERESFSREFNVSFAHFVSVGAEFMFPFPVSNNGIFADGWLLERIGDLPGGECEAPAREPYDRTYYVYHGSATPVQRQAVYDLACAGQYTCGPSFDDAGIGCRLRTKTIVAFGVPTGEYQIYRDWYAQWYPNITHLEFRPFPFEPTPIEYLRPAEAQAVTSVQILGGGVDSWGEYFALTQPSAAKAVLTFGELNVALQYSRHTLPVGRLWVPDQDKYKWCYGFPNYMAAAEEWFNLLIPNVLANLRAGGYTNKRVLFETLNETWDYDITSNTAASNFDNAALDVVARWNRDTPDFELIPIVMIAAVGNPPLPEDDESGQHWELLLELARHTMAVGGVWGYHAYWLAVWEHPEYFYQYGPWLQYRWMRMREYLATHDIVVNWLFTESGPCGGTVDDNGIWLNSGAGWKIAYGDNDAGWQRAQNEMLLFEQDIKSIPEVIGCTHFQCGSNDDAWKPFAIEGIRLSSLAHAIS